MEHVSFWFPSFVVSSKLAFQYNSHDPNKAGPRNNWYTRPRKTVIMPLSKIYKKIISFTVKKPDLKTIFCPSSFWNLEFSEQNITQINGQWWQSAPVIIDHVRAARHCLKWVGSLKMCDVSLSHRSDRVSCYVNKSRWFAQHAFKKKKNLGPEAQLFLFLTI